MSFRVDHGAIADDLLRYRHEAGPENFQINFHGNRDLSQLLQSMEIFMAKVASAVA